MLSTIDSDLERRGCSLGQMLFLKGDRWQRSLGGRLERLDGTEKFRKINIQKSEEKRVKKTDRRPKE